jgi:hypothetical protein
MKDSSHKCRRSIFREWKALESRSSKPRVTRIPTVVYLRVEEDDEDEDANESGSNDEYEGEGEDNPEVGGMGGALLM